MAFKDLAKPWFETDDFPTQEQFYTVFEWLRWKDEAIDLTEVAGLSDLINQLGGSIAVPPLQFQTRVSYTIPEGFAIEKLTILNPTDTTCQGGDTVDGDELFGPVPILAGKKQIVRVDVVADGGPRTVHFYVPLVGSVICTIKIFIYKP